MSDEVFREKLLNSPLCWWLGLPLCLLSLVLLVRWATAWIGFE